MHTTDLRMHMCVYSRFVCAHSHSDIGSRLRSTLSYCRLPCTSDSNKQRGGDPNMVNGLQVSNGLQMATKWSPCHRPFHADLQAYLSPHGYKNHIYWSRVYVFCYSYTLVRPAQCADAYFRYVPRPTRLGHTCRGPRVAHAWKQLPEEGSEGNNTHARFLNNKLCPAVLGCA